MNHFTLSALATCIASIGPAFLFFNSRKLALRVLGLYWVFICFWSSTVAFQATLLKIMSPFFWGWLLHFGCLMIPAFFLHFAVLYSDQWPTKKIVVISSYVLSLIYLILNSFTPYFTFETSYRDQYAYPTPSNVYPLYFISFVSMVLYGTFLMIKAPNIKKNIWFVIYLVAHSLAYIGAMDNFLIMANIRVFPLYPFGLYMVVPYALVGSYSIFKLEHVC